MKHIKPFRNQFVECRRNGLNCKTEFQSFKDHPEMMPLFNRKMIGAIKEKKIDGLSVNLCGKFGGYCNSGNEHCKRMRIL